METETFKSDDNDSVNKHSDFQEKAKEVTDYEIFNVKDRVLKEEENEASWEKELKGDNDIEFTILTKQDYLRLCNGAHNNLQSLLVNGMATEYAFFSGMFKRFRLGYAHNLKLLGKILELKSVQTILESRNKNLVKKLDKRDEEEKELKDSYMEIRNAIAKTVKEKNDIEKQRDELSKKISQLPEEIIRAAGDYSLTLPSEEIKRLETQLSEAKEKIALMKNDHIFTQKRETLFRNKYNEAKALHASFQEEIVSARREMALQMQMRENANTVLSEKMDQIKTKTSTIEKLNEEIAKLHKTIDHEKHIRRRFYVSMLSFKKSLTESEKTISHLQNERSTRQFHLTVLKIRTQTLEQEIEKNLTEIHALKVKNSKISKERSIFARNVRALEEDCKRLKDEFEKVSQTNKRQVLEIERLEKDHQLITNDYKGVIQQIMKIDHEYRLAKGVIRKKQNEMKILRNHNETASREISAKSQQIEELKNIIVKNRNEKNKLIEEIRARNAVVAKLKETIKELEKGYTNNDDKIEQLTLKIQEEKDQYKYLKDMHRELNNLYRDTKQELENTKTNVDMVGQRNKIQITQIDSLQEKLSKRDKQIAALNIKIKSSTAAALQQEFRCNQLSEELRIKEKEIMDILNLVSEKETEIETLKRESKSLVTERMLTKSQLEEKQKLIKTKNAESRLKQQELLKCEQELQDRIADIRLLKSEVEDLRRKEEILKSQKQDLEKLRGEINNVHRQILEEKLKSKTMEEEIQKKQNIHRWRILEAEDPTRSLLIAKNLKYQKDLVKKTDELRHKEKELLDKNHQITEFQNNFKKHVEAQSEVSMWTYKKKLQECEERIKCLRAEIAMYESLTAKQEIDIKELKDEISRLKASAYKEKLIRTKAAK